MTSKTVKLSFSLHWGELSRSYESLDRKQFFELHQAFYFHSSEQNKIFIKFCNNDMFEAKPLPVDSRLRPQWIISHLKYKIGFCSIYSFDDKSFALVSAYENALKRYGR